MNRAAMVRLRDLGKWSGGNTPSKANPAYWTDGTVQWVSPKDMKVHEIATSEDRVTEAALSEGRVSLLPEGSVLLVTRSGILAHTLPVAVTRLPVTINQDLKALTPREGISPKYVAHALRSAGGRILKKCSKHGTTVASIETNALLDFEIPLVDLDLQHRIVAEIEKQFSRLDEAVANLKRVKANLRRYKASVLKAAVEGSIVSGSLSSPPEAVAPLEAILTERRKSWVGRGVYKEPMAGEAFTAFALPHGWASATIEQVSRAIEYGSSAKTGEDAGGIPVLRMGNIIEGEIDFSELKYLPSDHDEFPKLLLESGDLLFNRTNSPELVGKTAVFGSLRPCSFASYLIRVKTVPGCKPEFIAAFINSVYGRRWIKSVVTQQVGQANVNGTKLQALVIPLPSAEEQHCIVAEVNRRLSIVRAIEAEVDANLERADRLRRAVLANAFAVTPQNVESTRY